MTANKTIKVIVLLLIFASLLVVCSAGQISPQLISKPSPTSTKTVLDGESEIIGSDTISCNSGYCEIIVEGKNLRGKDDELNLSFFSEHDMEVKSIQVYALKPKTKNVIKTNCTPIKVTANETTYDSETCSNYEIKQTSWQYEWMDLQVLNGDNKHYAYMPFFENETFKIKYTVKNILGKKTKYSVGIGTNIWDPLINSSKLYSSNGSFTLDDNATLTTVTVADTNISLGTSSSSSLLTDLSGYWEFEGNVSDVHGTNHWTDQGTADFAGKIRRARDFVAAQSDYIDSGNGSMDQLIKFNHTIAFWMQNEMQQANSRVFEFASGANQGLSYTSESDGNFFMIYNDGAETFEHQTGGGVIKQSDWVLVVGMWNVTTQTGHLYLNATVVNTTTNTGGAMSGGDDIGRRGDGNAVTYFDGRLDEFAIWDRHLTQTEINDLYNSGTGVAYVNFTTTTFNSSQDIYYSSTFQLGINTSNFTANIKEATIGGIFNNTYNLSCDGGSNWISFDSSNLSSGIFSTSCAASGDQLVYSIELNGNTTHSSSVSLINISFDGNNAPTHDTPTLNSSVGTNLTNESLTVYAVNVQDLENDPVKNITNWYMNNRSITLLNVPFEEYDDLSDLRVKDYAYGLSATTFGSPVWNSTGGVDGKGAYNLVGGDDIFRWLDTSLFHGMVNGTIIFWLKPINITAGRVLFQKSSAGNNVGDITVTIDAFEKINFALENAAGSTTVGTGSGIPINQWTMIGLRWFTQVPNLTNFSIWIDGRRKAFSSISNTIPLNNSQNLFLLATTAPEGYIDEFSLFNRSLSEEQLLELNSSITLNTLVANETGSFSWWSVNVTPNDGFNDGTLKTTNYLMISDSPPQFDHTLANLTVNHNESFLYDINCTDPDGENISFSINTSRFLINGTGHLTNGTYSAPYNVRHEVAVTCLNTHPGINVTETMWVNVTNTVPAFDVIVPNFLLAANISRIYDVNCTDPELDSITYGVNDSRANMTASTGVMVLNVSDVFDGNITASCYDGDLNATQQFNVRSFSTQDVATVTFTAPITETFNESYTLNITYFANITTDVNASLNLNGVAYTSWDSKVSGNNGTPDWNYTQITFSVLTPLIATNNTNITHNYDYTTFYYGTSIASKTTSNSSQAIYWAFNITSFEGNETIFEGETSNITVNVSNTSQRGSYFVFTEWNQTNFTLNDKTNDSWNREFATTLVNVSEYNITIRAYLNITFNGTSLIRNSNQERVQKIKKMSLDNCSVGTVQLLNYTFWQEKSRSTAVTIDTFGFYIKYYVLGGSPSAFRTFNQTYSNLLLFKFCAITPEKTYAVDIDSYWEEAGFDTREYRIENGLVNNKTTAILAYLLDTTNSTAITITVTDGSDVELENVYVFAYQFDIINKSEILLGSEVTDVNGKVVFNLDVVNEYYLFKLYRGGTLELTTDPQKLTETAYTFRIVGTQARTFNTYRTLLTQTTKGLHFNNLTNVVNFDYADPNNLTSRVCMDVYLINASEPEVITTQCSAAQSGNLTYTVPYQNSRYRAIGYCVARIDGNIYPFSTLDFVVGLFTNVLGVEGVLYGIMLVATLWIIGITIVGKPTAGLWFAGLGVFLNTVLGFFNIPLGIITGVVFAIIIVIAALKD